MEELEEIIAITTYSFDQDLKDNPFIFVLFHKTQVNEDLESFGKIFKEFKKAYKEAKLRQLPVKFAIVDSANNPKVAEDCGITEFPKLRLFVDSAYVEYIGGNLAEDIIYFLQVKLEEPSTEFYIPEDLDKFLENREVLVFFGEANKVTNPKYRQFLQIARNHDDVLFASCGMMECIEHYKIGWNEFIFFKKHLNQDFELKDPWTDYMVTRLIEDKYTRIMPKFDEWVADFIFVRNNVGLFLFRDEDIPEHKKYELVVKRVSKYFKGFIHFANVDIKNKYEMELAKITKVNKSHLPCIYIYDARSLNILMYKLEGEISEVNITSFALDFLATKLQPYYASEELVEDDKQTHPVMKLVAKAFEKSVQNDNENYALIMIFGEDCEHCHKALKLFEKLAKFVLEKNKKINFYKLNGDLNDLPGVDIIGYPFIKLYLPMIKTKTVDYPIENDRSIKRLAEFLINNIPNFDMSNINNKLDEDFEVEYDDLNDINKDILIKEDI